MIVWMPVRMYACVFLQFRRVNQVDITQSNVQLHVVNSGLFYALENDIFSNGIMLQSFIIDQRRYSP